MMSVTTTAPAKPPITVGLTAAAAAAAIVISAIARRLS
jgi:hypothetical protein